jgi:hypothetical protein
VSELCRHEESGNCPACDAEQRQYDRMRGMTTEPTGAETRELLRRRIATAYLDAIAQELNGHEFSLIVDQLIDGTITPAEVAASDGVTVSREVIDNAVQDGFAAARKRWNEKLREYDGELDALDAYAVEVTAIVDSVYAALQASDPATTARDEREGER